MENYTHPEPRKAYGVLLLAAAATVALIASCCLPLMPPVGAFDAETAEALGILSRFLLRAALVVPLLCFVPALWARSAWRTGPLSLLPLCLVAFLSAYLCEKNLLTSLFALLLIAPAGILLYGMQRAGFSNFKVVFYGSIAMLFGLFARIGGPALTEHGDAFLLLRTLLGAYETLWRASMSDGFNDAMRAFGLQAGEFETLLASLRLNAENYFVMLLYYPAALAALSNGLLSHLLNRKGEVGLSPLPPFARWQVEPSYFYGTLLLMGIAYALAFSRAANGPALMNAAYAIWMLPMSLAGLCTLKRWTAGRPWLFAILCVGTGMLFSVFGSLLTFVGMMGFLRERMEQRRKKGGDE